MRVRKLVLLTPSLILSGVFSFVGCGSQPEFTPPKTELTEQEQQKILELDAQRQREWSTTPPAPESGS